MPSDATTPPSLTIEEVDRITSLAAEGYGAGPNVVGLLVADWRRLTAEIERLRTAEARWAGAASAADVWRGRAERAEAEAAVLRKAMPGVDLLFNAAYLLRGTWDDKCVAMAPSLERAAAGILALAADDDARADALIELVRRA